MRSSIIWIVTPVDFRNLPLGKQRLYKRASKAWNMSRCFERCLIEKNYYGSTAGLIRKAYKSWVVCNRKRGDRNGCL